MAHHVGVLPEDLLHAISNHIEEAAADHGTNMESNRFRFLRLPHPRTGIPSLFLPYELPLHGQSTILEVQAVSPPNRRSWFTSEEVVEDGKLLIMTPIDPAFLLIPILQAAQPVDGLGNFRPADDLIEEAANKMISSSKSSPKDDGGASISSDDIVYLSSLSCVQAAMRHVCEFKEIAHDIVVFRYSSERVRTYLRAKVGRLSHQDVSEMSRTLTRGLAKDGLLEDGKEALLTDSRLRCACDLVSQYLPRDTYEDLLSSYDFTALDAHMKVLKDEAMALAAVNMNSVEARESKDNKEMQDASGDKKRKAKGSTGVEKLKKANIKGMSKISTFFQKK